MSRLLLLLLSFAALVCLVLPQLFVQASSEVATAVTYPSFIFATTDSIYDNSSLVQVSTVDGSIIKVSNEVGRKEIDSYLNVAFDSVSRTIMLLSVSTLKGVIDMFDADTLKLVNRVHLNPFGIPADIQFDSKLQTLFGVGGSSGRRLSISKYNLKTGHREELIKDIPGMYSVIDSCLVYDSVNHYYYVAATPSNGTLHPALLKYNMITKQLEKKIPVPDFIQNAQIDPRTNMLYGVTSSSEFASLDLTTGNYTVYNADQLNMRAIGYTERNAGGIDINNGYYYVLYNNPQGQTHWIQVNYKKLVIESVWPYYNHIGNSIFVPGSTSFTKL